MREFSSFGEFADFLERLVPMVPRAEHEALQQGAHIVERRAKEIIGTEYPGWPALAPDTLSTKERLGYPIPFPLLRTGDMRDSIGYTFTSALMVEVGSNDPKAEWHEMGTSRIPARPFLTAAAVEKQDEVAALVGRSVYLVLLGTRAA